ncbi:LysR family transcriptional regulator [Enterovibrio sp. NIFS-20-8]|nr:LysR family transcriptional regulator [Enterovibrio paralichthyis]
MFCVLSETLNFTEAAECLSISQPTLSRKISQLEQAINVRLFHRGGNQMHLTPQGRMFLETSHQILERLDNTLERIHDSPETIRGDISIGLLHPMARFLSDSFFKAFKQRHPNVNIRLTTLHPADLTEMPDCDVMLSPMLPSDLSLVAKPLMHFKCIFCASPDYIELHGEPTQPIDLALHACITNTNCPRPNSAWHWVDGKGNSGSVNVGGGISSDSVDIAINLATAGMGIAFVPKGQVVEKLETGELLELFNGEYFSKGTIYAIYRTRAYLPTRFTVFMDELKAFFEQSILN